MNFGLPRAWEGGAGPQGPIPILKKSKEKPEGENRLSRGPKSSHGELRSSHVLNSVDPDPS